MTGSVANSLTFNTHSYLLGNRFICRLNVPPHLPLDRVTNVGLDFFRIERMRDEFALGLSVIPRIVEGMIEVEHNFPIDLTPGLYGIAEVRLFVDPADHAAASLEPASPNFVLTFDPIIIQVRTAIEQLASPQAIAQQAAAVFERRLQLANKPHIVDPQPDVSEQQRFLIFVFGVGCLLHRPQQLEGFALLPLSRGLSHRNMSELVNAFLADNGFEPLPFTESTEQAFAASTPVFVVSYPVVVAARPEAAIAYCRKHADLVFNILGIDRGQKPRAFAYVATQHDTTLWWHHFDFPGYRGNWLSDFNPAKTANEIERLMPRLETNPFSRLIVGTYADATAAQEYGFALLRFWSVLELVAERNVAGNTKVLHPDGTVIVNAKGNPETTNSKHGRVYAYILAK